MTTLISHFYNEEFLLPYWLMHHRRIFDHGIMINHNSTDNSADIIKHYCPDWQIVNTKLSDFDVYLVDQEVMEYEKTVVGWKTVLNTTEILLIDDLNYYLKDKSKNIITQGIIMVEDYNERHLLLDKNKDLFLQRFCGFMECLSKNKIINESLGRDTYIKRSRLIHKEATGRYVIGRHSSELTNIQFDPNLFLCWFGFSPYKVNSKRKEQIFSRFPKDDIVKFRIIPHDRSSYFKWYKNSLIQSDNMLLDKNYKQAIINIINKYNLEFTLPENNIINKVKLYI